MFNNYKPSSITINYINKTNRILKNALSEIESVCQTNSISYDFINQMIPYQKIIMKIAEYTPFYTRNCQILDITKDVLTTYPEIIEDMKSIKKSCKNFRSCSDCLDSYHKDFRRIFQSVFSNFKSNNCKQNINFYFLRFTEKYYTVELEILENLLKYRIFPQLRLISQYMLCLSNKELKKLKNIQL